MSDYLGDLIVKHLNLEEVIQPRPIALFEPATTGTGWLMSNPVFEIKTEQDTDATTPDRLSPMQQSVAAQEQASVPRPPRPASHQPSELVPEQPESAERSLKALEPDMSPFVEPELPNTPIQMMPQQSPISESGSPQAGKTEQIVPPNAYRPPIVRHDEAAGEAHTLTPNERAPELSHRQAEAAQIARSQEPRPVTPQDDAANSLPSDNLPSDNLPSQPGNYEIVAGHIDEQPLYAHRLPVVRHEADATQQSELLAEPSHRQAGMVQLNWSQEPRLITPQDDAARALSSGNLPPDQPGNYEIAAEQTTLSGRVQSPNPEAEEKIIQAPSLRPALSHRPPEKVAGQPITEELVMLPEKTQPSAPITVRPQVKQYIEPTPLAPTLPEAIAEPTPTVQVTIGRIEVRATPPPPVSSSQTRRSAPSIMTLDEYLQQRARGDEQ